MNIVILVEYLRQVYYIALWLIEKSVSGKIMISA